MSNVMFKLRKKIEDGLKSYLTGDVMVRIDEKRDELFICVKTDDVDEFAQIIDHLSDKFFNGKSVESFICDFRFDYWNEMASKLRRKMFKK